MAPSLWYDQLPQAALVELCNPDASVLKSPNRSRRRPRVLARLLQCPSPPKAPMCGYTSVMSKSLSFTMRLSNADKLLFQGAANMAEMPLAECARMVMRQEARRQAERQGREDEHDRR